MLFKMSGSLLLKTMFCGQSSAYTPACRHMRTALGSRCCVSYFFPIAVTKDSGRKQLKEEKVYFDSRLRVQLVMTGASWLQELEAADRSQSMD